MADTFISSATSTLGQELLVEANSATVYAAHENSMFLNGQLIPVLDAPNGLLKVPKLSKPAADSVSGGVGDAITADVAVTNPASSDVNIVADLIAVRSVVRDLGNIDPREIGRAGGQGVAAGWDATVMGAIGGLTSYDIDAVTDLTMNHVFDAVSTIRAAGENGPLAGIVSPDTYTEIMTLIGGAAYAGGDEFQSQVMRSGFLGRIAGVPFFVSSYFDATNTGLTAPRLAIFGQDAIKIGMQRNVTMEIARRPEAVGYDVVTSLMAGVDVVDATRGVILNEEA